MASGILRFSQLEASTNPSVFVFFAEGGAQKRAAFQGRLQPVPARIKRNLVLSWGMAVVCFISSHVRRFETENSHVLIHGTTVLLHDGAPFWVQNFTKSSCPRLILRDGWEAASCRL